MLPTEDTIVAPATAPGSAAIGIVRLSGPQALPILRKVFRTKAALQPRVLCFGEVVDGEQLVDRCLAVYFAAPQSYTGEECAELQLHGGPITVRRAMNALIHAGARPAEPGEFTKRAFLNGKIDLTQAEAVMDMISARAAGGQRIAAQQLRGKLFQRITALQTALTELLAFIEVNADYPEEDLEESTSQECIEKLQGLIASLQEMLKNSGAGRALREGVYAAIVGVPNAGKSSLLNALCGEERAIVSDVPGTTRDTLDVSIALDGLCITLVDTAGIRHSGDAIEAMGIDRARKALDKADIALMVLDASRPIAPEDREIFACIQVPCILVLSKADIALLTEEEVHAEFPNTPLCVVSAKAGTGVEELGKQLYALCTGDVQAEWVELANERHIHSATQALEALQNAYNGLCAGFTPDVTTVDIRRCWRLLGEITGDTADERIIDEIFSRFCLGK